MTMSKGATMKHLMLLLLVFGVGAVDAQTVNPCRADIDRSGEVDFRDFQLLVDAYGTSKCGLYWLGEDIRLTNWDTLIVRDTIVVRDTLVVRETVRDTVLVIEREQPQPPLPAPPSNTTTTDQPLPAPSDTTTTDQPPPEQPQPPLPAPSDTTTTDQPPPEQPQPEQPQPERQWPGVSLVCSSETRAVLEVYEKIFRAHEHEYTEPPRGTLRGFILYGDSIRVTEETAVADFDNDGFISHHDGSYHRSDYGQYLWSLYHILREDPPFGQIPYDMEIRDSRTGRVHHGRVPHAMFQYYVFGRPDFLSGRGLPRFVIAPPTEVFDGSPNGLRERGRDYPPAFHSFCGEADRYIRLGEY